MYYNMLYTYIHTTYITYHIHDMHHTRGNSQFTGLGSGSLFFWAGFPRTQGKSLVLVLVSCALKFSKAEICFVEVLITLGYIEYIS